MTQTCLVRGSINVDEFFHLPHIVKPGETISSTSLSRRAGGKGANQACAVARSGETVQLVGAVGQDGIWVKDLLQSYGVGVEGVEVEKEGVTGRAIIQLDREGENCIILHAGTNHSPLPLPSSLPGSPSPSYLLLQNEIPLDQTIHYLSLTTTSKSKCSAVFNPSPMLSPSQIASFPWSQLGWLAVNEGEMEELLANLGPAPARSSEEERVEVVYVGDLSIFGGSEVKKHEEKIKWLKGTLEPDLLKLSRHPSFSTSPSTSSSSSAASSSSPKIILTLGSAGSLALLPPSSSPNSSSRQKKYTIIFTPSASLQGSARDTTGAGDCFTGFFVGSLMKGGEEGEEVEKVVEALRVATQAAGMCCERHGAQEAVPTLEEVMGRLASLA